MGSTFEDGVLSSASVCEDGVPVSGGGGGGASGWSVGNLSTTYSPVGLWTLDGNLTDSSGNGNDLTEQTGTAVFTDYMGKKWWYADGATILSAGTAAELNLTGDCTCFVTLRIMTDGNLGSYIMGRGDEGSAGANNWNYLLWMNSGNFRGFHEYDAGLQGGQPLLGAIPQPDVAFGILTLALVRDATANEYRWFMDGVLVETDTYTTDANGGASTTFRMGGSSIGSFLLDKCMVRNAAVYDSALSAAQIAAIHTESLG